ncbi:MAG: hypothetical protein RDV48_13730 [Candidatus Eremiobacteraeota bacterium]|nr:hypothetical protein [Candidatus Eremiobacteraeota bacterium]
MEGPLRKICEGVDKVTSEEHTEQLVGVLDALKSYDAKADILAILSRKGKDTIVAPVFLDILQNKSDKKAPLSHQIATDYLERSSDPRVISFLMSQLSDERASQSMRELAFVALARNGGEKGREAVLFARRHIRTHPRLERALDMEKLIKVITEPRFEAGLLKLYANQEKPVNKAFMKKHEKEIVFNQAEFSGHFQNQLLSLKKEKDGTLWGLFLSPLLGSTFDLWVFRMKGTREKEYYFTGASYMTLKGKSWAKELINNSEIEKDSDSDGLTDLMEKRLGTNPENGDTDGDGLADAIDSNPTAAPRSLESDEEKIIYAAYEARFMFDGGRNVPCVVELPKGIKPFELSGWRWITIPEESGHKASLRKVRDEGAAFVSFLTPGLDFEGKAILVRDNVNYIVWNQDHTEAKLELITSFGPLDATGYDIHLRKFGDTWFVIEMKMAWIS